MIHDKIIVLRTIKYSESDLIVHGLNTGGEKRHFIAKGALRSRRRFSGGILESTHYIQVSYGRRTQKKEKAMHFLHEASLIEDFPKIRTSYERLEMSFYFLKMTSKVGLEGDCDSPRLFHLLGHSLRCLETTGDLNKLKFFFEAKLMEQQGVLPFDTSLREVISTSILDHEQVSSSSEDWRMARSLVRHSLQDYLNI